MDKYIAVVQKNEDSAYGAYFPDLTGCFAAGDSEDEVLENLRISLRMYAEDLVEDGKKLPKPRRVREVLADPEVKDDISDRSGFLVVVPLLYAGRKRRVNVTLEPSLIAAVDEAARIAGTSRSDYLANAAWSDLAAKMGAVRVGVRARPAKKGHAQGKPRRRTRRVA